MFTMLTAGYYMFARSSESSSASYLTSANRNLVLNHTYCLSFYFYVAAPRHRPSSVSMLVYVTSDQVCAFVPQCGSSYRLIFSYSYSYFYFSVTLSCYCLTDRDWSPNINDTSINIQQSDRVCR